MDMPNLRRTKRRHQSDFEFLQGGQISDGNLRRHVANLKKKGAAELSEKSAIRQEAAKYLSQAQPTIADDKKLAQAEKGLRAFSERLAKQKLSAPKKVIRPPIPIWGTYTLKFTPPYTGLGTYSVGQISSVTGNPSIS